MKLVSSFNGYRWTTIDQDTYDGAPDAGRFARMIGIGQTKEESIQDFKNQLFDYTEGAGYMEET